MKNKVYGAFLIITIIGIIGLVLTGIAKRFHETDKEQPCHSKELTKSSPVAGDP